MSSFRLAVRLFFFAFAINALVPSLFSQGTTLGTITGTVLDPSGAAVPGARLRVINTGTGVVREATSDSNGNFTVVSLIPGTYNAEASAPSFQRQVQENL